MTFIPNLNFLEFIPEKEHFKWQLDNDYQPRTLLLNELKAGEKYELGVKTWGQNLAKLGKLETWGQVPNCEYLPILNNWFLSKRVKGVVALFKG